MQSSESAIEKQDDVMAIYYGCTHVHTDPNSNGEHPDVCPVCGEE